MMNWFRPRLIFASCACFFLLSCQSAPTGPGPLRVAFIGPSTTTLRRDLAVQSPVVATLKHGERVDILETRHVMLKVRSQDNVEGWIDANLLLMANQVDELQRITQLAAGLPSQGKATVESPLNVHTGPNRRTPNLFQVPENGAVEVLAHRSTPRGSLNANSAVVDAVRVKQPPPVKKVKNPKTTKVESASNKKASSSSLPSALLQGPPAPAPPGNWERISVPRLADIEAAVDTKGGHAGHEPPPPPAVEDWSLVRYTAPGTQPQVGWVLSRMVYMALPDDTVRYTDGKRVTAFLDLGEVEDEGRMKHNWMWTTVTTRGKPYDFDAFRVIVWNRVKHRYETAHVERDLVGRYPVKIEAIPVGGPASGEPEKRRSRRSEKQVLLEQTQFVQKENRFSIVAEDPETGRTYSRIYALVGRRVRLISSTALNISSDGSPQEANGLEGSVAEYDPLAETAATQGWWARSSASVKRNWRAFARRWSKEEDVIR